MEGAVSVMESLWTNATTVVSKISELLGTMTTTLLGNPLYQLVIGMIVFSIGYGVVMSLTRKFSRRGR